MGDGVDLPLELLPAGGDPRIADADLGENGWLGLEQIFGGLIEVLRSREQPDGLLAPWSTWWPREHIEAVVGEHRGLITTDEPRVPLRLLTEQPLATEDWLAPRSGYVAFGSAYAAQETFVETRGWEVRRLDGDHLHLLIAPDEVADTVLEVAARLD